VERLSTKPRTAAIISLGVHRLFARTLQYFSAAHNRVAERLSIRFAKGSFARCNGFYLLQLAATFRRLPGGWRNPEASGNRETRHPLTTRRTSSTRIGSCTSSAGSEQSRLRAVRRCSVLRLCSRNASGCAKIAPTRVRIRDAERGFVAQFVEEQLIVVPATAVTRGAGQWHLLLLHSCAWPLECGSIV
jgi:hypothetical protein